MSPPSQEQWEATSTPGRESRERDVFTTAHNLGSSHMESDLEWGLCLNLGSHRGMKKMAAIRVCPRKCK